MGDCSLGLPGENGLGDGSGSWKLGGCENYRVSWILGRRGLKHKADSSATRVSSEMGLSPERGSYLTKVYWNYLGGSCRNLRYDQRAPNPAEFAQIRLSRSNGGHPQREGSNLVLPFVKLQICVCLICVISPYSNGAVQIRVGLELQAC